MGTSKRFGILILKLVLYLVIFCSLLVVANLLLDWTSSGRWSQYQTGGADGMSSLGPRLSHQVPLGVVLLALAWWVYLAISLAIGRTGPSWKAGVPPWAGSKNLPMVAARRFSVIVPSLLLLLTLGFLVFFGAIWLTDVITGDAWSKLREQGRETEARLIQLLAGIVSLFLTFFLHRRIIRSWCNHVLPRIGWLWRDGC